MKALFLTPVGEINNLTPITFGLIRALEKAGLNVTFIKPIIKDNPKIAINQIYQDYFDKQAAKSIPYSDAEKLIRQGRYDQILEDVIENINNANYKSDLIVVEGLENYEKNPFIDKLNLDIARTLCAGVLFSGNSGKNSAQDIAEYLDLQADLFKYAHTWYAGYIINRVMDVNNIKNVDELCQIKEAKELDQIGAIPENYDDLSKPDLIDFIASNITTISLIEKLRDKRDKRMPPSIFRYSLIDKARKANKRIVLPEGNEPRTIRAALICAEKKIARCVLLGDRDNIESIIDNEGLKLDPSIEIINPASIADQYIDGFVERRSHRGATTETAKEALKDNVVLGTMMLANNDVDGLVSGAVHTTADTIRPALQLIGTDKNSSIVSSVFFMLMSDQVHVYGDCAVNPSPTPEQLADIAIQSAESAATFGINPKVAMISYSTGASGAGEEVEKVDQATKLAQAKAPHFPIDGPLQFDSACVPSVGKQKAPNSPVAGYATVFVFPDLNTGNTTYKAVQRSANIVSIGPMLQGLAKPVNDLSRGASVDDIVYTIAITALQAINK